MSFWMFLLLPSISLLRGHLNENSSERFAKVFCQSYMSYLIRKCSILLWVNTWCHVTMNSMVTGFQDFVKEHVHTYIHTYIHHVYLPRVAECSLYLRATDGQHTHSLTTTPGTSFPTPVLHQYYFNQCFFSLPLGHAVILWCAWFSSRVGHYISLPCWRPSCSGQKNYSMWISWGTKIFKPS